jgi:murein DD-endopeptidase MepM/ murein hydrolase activator NlpD
MRFLFLSIFLTSLLFSFNYKISATKISNGATALLEFDKEEDVVYEKIKFKKKYFNIYENPLDENKLYVLLPISYYQKLGDNKVKLFIKERGVAKIQLIDITIKQGDYKKEKIQVTKSKVNPKKKYSKRIFKEYQEAIKLYGSSTKYSFLKSPFILPLDSFITSDFGKARIYNDTLKGYHGGTDFRARVPTPIKATNDGRVVLVKDRFYSGGTVVIDHGQGIYSCYFHMSKFFVEAGERIGRGEIIGLSGKSGRVTGPHLHFAFRVGGIQVDPLQFIKLMNENILNKGKE